MKFLISKELSQTTLMRKLMIAVCVALFFYLGLDVLLHAYVFGFELSDISSTLYGNAEEFIEPILLDTLLLQVHIDLFMSLLSMMIIASIYIRLYSEDGFTKIVVHALFILGLIAPLLLIVSYFTAMACVYAWLGSFMLGHLLGMGMSLRIVGKLLFK